MDDACPLPSRLAALVEDLPFDELAFTPVPVRARRDGWSDLTSPRYGATEKKGFFGPR